MFKTGRVKIRDPSHLPVRGGAEQGDIDSISNLYRQNETIRSQNNPPRGELQYGLQEFRRHCSSSKLLAKQHAPREITHRLVIPNTTRICRSQTSSGNAWTPIRREGSTTIGEVQGTAVADDVSPAFGIELAAPPRDAWPMKSSTLRNQFTTVFKRIQIL
jgi:hypothetical protein